MGFNVSFGEEAIRVIGSESPGPSAAARSPRPPIHHRRKKRSGAADDHDHHHSRRHTSTHRVGNHPAEVGGQSDQERNPFAARYLKTGEEHR